MKYTSLLASSAALAAIAIVVPASAPTSWNLSTPAQAANVNISFSLFYDDLGRHGDWVSYHDAYVFVPARRDRYWRPYTHGHWIYASTYGWTWISDEPFGWATYHYGRWGFDEDIGWYWVPGTRWAPAWVSWRRSGSHVAWAPLPPSRGWGGGDSDFTVAFDFDTQPDYYWNVVPAQSFLTVNLFTVIIKDDDDRRRRVREAEYAGNVKIENNVVVNNAIEVNYIEKETGKEVKQVEVKQTDNPENAKASEGEVTAFTGKVEADPEAKPPKITEAEEVKKRAKSGDQAEQTGEQTEQTGDAAVEAEADTEAAQTGKKDVKAKHSGEAAVEAEADEPVAQTGKKSKKELKAEQSSDVEVEAEAEAAQTGKQKEVKETEALSAEGEAEAEAVPTRKKKVLEEEEEPQ